MRSRDAVAQLSFYSSTADRSGRQGLSSEVMLKNLQSNIRMRRGLWVVKMEDVVVERHTNTEAEIHLVKHIIEEPSPHRISELFVPARLILERENGVWKIFSEQDSPSSALNPEQSRWSAMMWTTKRFASGNFCLGAWKQTGHNSFALSHYALNWSALTFDSKGNLVIDPTTKGPLNTFIGPSSIRENVTVDAGKDYYEGTFRLENFDQTGKGLVTLVGKVTGQRLTADSPSFVP
jgi:hypothetical protein